MNEAFGYSEPLRRFIQRESFEPQANEIRNTMPSWLPGDDYMTNFKVGDPYVCIDDGYARLPGAGYEAIHPELKSVYSEDYPDIHKLSNARHPWQSVNYVVSHDGFTLYDTVAYNNKHNEANGENNSDGPSENFSWNCGFEGEVGVSADVMRLRRQQVKNFWTILLLSNGTPMVRMGDEFLQTQNGNSNPYNQDHATSWLDWSRLTANQDIFRFARLLIAFRNAHPAICRSRFWRGDVSWYGTSGGVDMSVTSHTIAYVIHGASQNDTDIYVMINMYWEDLPFTLQEPGTWKRVVDTGNSSPDDIPDPGSEPVLASPLTVKARSVVVAIKG